MKTPRNPVRRDRKHGKYSEAIMELYGGRCHLCGKKGADTIDHLVPVAWGGSDHPANLKPAHRSCNSSKGAERPPRSAWASPVLWIDGKGAAVVEQGRMVRPPASLSKWVQGLGWALMFIGVVLVAPGAGKVPKFIENWGGLLFTVGLVFAFFGLVGWWLGCRRYTRLARAAEENELDEWDWLEVEFQKAGLDFPGG